MKKIIYTLIAAFVACTAVAQTPSAYFMEGSTFRSQLNPAFAPLRGYVNIPVLGGVQVNVSGNLSVSDIFYPVNGSLVTLFDKKMFLRPRRWEICARKICSEPMPGSISSVSVHSARIIRHSGRST